MPSTIQQALQSAEESLADSSSARLDAELLLAHCLSKSREHFFTYPNEELASGDLRSFLQLVQRRQQGEPVAYITGVRSFWDMELMVTADVLVPRPETELLVESALELFDASEQIRAVDLGTGSGAIALALANSRPGWQLVAVDVSAAALGVARSNAERYQLSNIEFKQASWCDGLEAASYDLILANPPYVAPGDDHLQQGDLRFEPNLALQSAQAGYADLFTIGSQSRRCLKPGGRLLVEHGYDQREKLEQELLNLGYTEIESSCDLAGHPRMMQGIWPGY
ncbi:MAG: peptide chain release factor N(5)-glutamine methyltransferase [Pseudomonadales bacterium]|nr:peptide chain release factor N(5)-glutamine methyltransferase [Pseudomonadales bacterium]